MTRNVAGHAANDWLKGGGSTYLPPSPPLPPPPPPPPLLLNEIFYSAASFLISVAKDRRESLELKRRETAVRPSNTKRLRHDAHVRTSAVMTRVQAYHVTATMAWPLFLQNQIEESLKNLLSQRRNVKVNGRNPDRREERRRG